MNLDKQILKEIGQIATHHPEIQKILLFGSRARGDNEIYYINLKYTIRVKFKCKVRSDSF